MNLLQNGSNSPLFPYPHPLKYYLKGSLIKGWNLLPHSLVSGWPHDILWLIGSHGSHSMPVPSLGLNRLFTFPVTVETLPPSWEQTQTSLLKCKGPPWRRAEAFQVKPCQMSQATASSQLTSHEGGRPAEISQARPRSRWLR